MKILGKIINNSPKIMMKLISINHPFKGILFCDFKVEFWSIRDNFSSIFHQNLDYKCFMKVEMSLKHDSIERF